MMKYLLWLGLAFIAWKIYSGSRKPYAGMVSTGWGGNITGNFPGAFDPMRVVGHPGAAPIALNASGANPYGPSLTTNAGSR